MVSLCVKKKNPKKKHRLIEGTSFVSVPLTMQPSRANVTAVTSHPVRCQTPVYAVVDKTRKKTNTRTHFAEAADDRGETRRGIAQGGDDNGRRTHNFRGKNVKIF